jgi:hypothetical protein
MGGNHGSPVLAGPQRIEKVMTVTERKPKWVVVPGLTGWVLEHDPETASGIAPIGKYRNEEGPDGE